MHYAHEDLIREALKLRKQAEVLNAIADKAISKLLTGKADTYEVESLRDQMQAVSTLFTEQYETTRRAYEKAQRL